jgi:hypothetical protein
MMINTPRTTAAKLVDAYLDGKDTAPILAGEDREAYRVVAKDTARAQLNMLRDHANIARHNLAYLHRLPTALRQQVNRYLRKHHYGNNDNDRREPRGRDVSGLARAQGVGPGRGAHRRAAAVRAAPQPAGPQCNPDDPIPH